jgi:hypothetical protein
MMTKDQSSGRHDFEQRLEDWFNAARDGIERQAPDVLDKLAATARDLARRLDDLAADARQKHAEKGSPPDVGAEEGSAPEAPPTSDPEAQTAAPGADTSEGSDEPPATSEQSGASTN